MKFREGFVSNSSSCSFVVIGFKLDENDNDAEKLYEEVERLQKEKGFDSDDYNEEALGNGLEIIDNMEAGAPNDSTIIVGTEVLSISDDSGGAEAEMIDFNEYKKIAEDFQIRVFGSVKYPIKMFTGTRMC